jgi:hypothetical protein
MTISIAIISTITIGLIVYTEAKADTAKSRETVLEATRADFVENMQKNTKIY